MFDRLCHFELEQIIKVDPAITFFNDFARFCHFELEQIIKVDPAIIFCNDFDRYFHFELEQKPKRWTPRLHLSIILTVFFNLDATNE